MSSENSDDSDKIFLIGIDPGSENMAASKWSVSKTTFEITLHAVKRIQLQLGKYNEQKYTNRLSQMLNFFKPFHIIRLEEQPALNARTRNICKIIKNLYPQITDTVPAKKMAALVGASGAKKSKKNELTIAFVTDILTQGHITKTTNALQDISEYNACVDGTLKKTIGNATVDPKKGTDEADALAIGYYIATNCVNILLQKQEPKQVPTTLESKLDSLVFKKRKRTPGSNNPSSGSKKQKTIISSHSRKLVYKRPQRKT